MYLDSITRLDHMHKMIIEFQMKLEILKSIYPPELQKSLTTTNIRVH